MSAPASASAGTWLLLAKVSLTAWTFRPGAKRAASNAQLPTTLVGATTKKGAPASGAEADASEPESPEPDAPEPEPEAEPPAAAERASSFAAHISASACTVLPR